MPNARLRQEDIAGEDTNGTADPALDPIQIAANQMDRLVRGMAEAITGPASRLRDEVDAIIRSTDARAESLVEKIEEFRDDTISGKQSIGIMSEGCTSLKKRLGGEVPPSVTQFPRRERQG